jgi:hypothetical protein
LPWSLAHQLHITVISRKGAKMATGGISSKWLKISHYDTETGQLCGTWNSTARHV